MKEIVLKESDERRMRAINHRNGWGISASQMVVMTNRYMRGSDYQKALIEYRLTDINCHKEVEMLRAGRYEELKQQVKEW